MTEQVVEHIAVYIFCVIGVIWGVTGLIGHRLLIHTRKEFPELVGEKITVPGLASPRNLLFFLDGRSKLILMRNEKILGLRRMFMIFGILSLLAPPLSFAVMVAFMFLAAIH